MSPTPEIFESAIFGMRGKICVAGPGNCPLFFVVPAAGILILKKNGKWRTGGMTVEYPGLKQGDIIFFARGSAFLHTAFPALNVLHKVCSI